MVCFVSEHYTFIKLKLTICIGYNSRELQEKMFLYFFVLLISHVVRLLQLCQVKTSVVKLSGVKNIRGKNVRSNNVLGNNVRDKNISDVFITGTFTSDLFTPNHWNKPDYVNYFHTMEQGS